MVSTETTAAMMEELSRAGLVVDGIVFGGELHRCGTVDKPNGKDGSYIAHADAPASLWWQNFPAGTSDTWTAKGDKSLSTNEKKALQARMEASKAKREAEQARRNEEAASKAQGIYSAAVDCVSHPYLERKGVQPVPGLKVSTDPKCASLIVPVRNESNKLVGLQFIHEDGSKKFLTGTAKKGGFFIIGGRDTDKPLLICEGLATGLSLYEAVGFPVLVAFDAGNLLPVAEMARGKYPERDIVLCADYDNPSDGYPAPGGIGLAKATEAAVAVGGSLAVPRHNGNKVDFNDLHQKMGAGEVLTQFMAHRKPDAVEVSMDTLFSEEPVPFDGEEAPAIDAGILPEALRVFASVISEAVQVPLELPLINALASMAIAVQGRAKVVIHDDYSEPLNIYAMVALPPGERKSSIVDLCKRPLREWVQEAGSSMKEIRMEAETDLRSLEKIIEGKRNNLVKASDDSRQELMAEIRRLEASLPEVPELPRLFVDDATPEAVAVLLAKHGERLGIQEAEGGIFDILAGRYTNGHANIDLFLKAWGGEPVTVDRRRGDALSLNAPLLTMCISPQPDVIKSLSDKPGFRGRGLLARFLYLLPQSRVGFRDIDTDTIPAYAKAVYADKVKAALAMQPSVMADGSIVPHELRLSAEANDIRRAFASYIEVSMKPGGELESMRDWANKIPGNAVRMSGLLHFFASGSPLATPITGETMEAAVTIAAIMVDHAKMAFALMEDNPAITGAKRILKWIREDVGDRGQFTSRECWQRFKSSYENMDEVKLHLSMLEDRGFIAEASPDTSGRRGRPSQVWLIHPSIKGGSK